MRFSLLRAIAGVFLMAGVAGFSLPVLANPAPPQLSPEPPLYVLDTQLRTQAIGDHNAGLDTGSGSENAGELAAEARFRLTVNFNPGTLFFWEGRGVAGAGQEGFEDADTGETISKNNFLEWRQSYFQFGNLDGGPLSIRAGRQKVREDYGDWWNRDFDALRLSYNSTQFNGFVLAGQDLFSYNTAENFQDDQKDIARMLAEGSWQYRYKQFLETRLLLQDDYSGIDNPGTIESTDNSNTTQGRLGWGGLRAAGETRQLMSGADKVQYRVDLMGVAGHENNVVTAPAGGSNAVVTGQNGRDVAGWAMDAGVDVPLPLALKPAVHLGYAYGSGDDNGGSGTDHAFRQNGLASNFSRIGDLSDRTDNYGTVLRPELSNIHIFSAGVTMPVFTASNAGLIYRYYRLAEPATSLLTSGVDNTLDGHDRDLGHALDLLYNMEIYKAADARTSNIKDIYLRSSLGAFRSGHAFGANDGDIAARGLMELGFQF